MSLLALEDKSRCQAVTEAKHERSAIDPISR